MRSITQQRGMTGIGWLIVLALIGFFVLLALRMVPHYLDYYKVVSTLAGLEAESGFESPGEIRRLLERRFDVSFISTITPEDVIIKNVKEGYTVTAKYETRESLMGNVSVVMDFEKQVLVKRH